jgi:hypothetical protein
MLQQGDQMTVYQGRLNLLLFQPLATNKPQVWGICLIYAQDKLCGVSN